MELATSIADNGVIHPVVVRKDEDGNITLVVGETRMKALDICWNLGKEVRCGEQVIPAGYVPCLFQGEMDPIAAFEMELEENVRRTDLDWKDKATAVYKLSQLRKMQAERDGKPGPTARTLAEEIAGTAEGQFGEDVRQDLILGQVLDQTPDLPAFTGITSRKEAFKALKRDEERKRNAELADRIGATFGAHAHTLIQGDCMDALPKLASDQFDVILTDPPYGISADSFGDSAGKGSAHGYEDSYDHWRNCINVLVTEGTRLTRPNAHAYVFCDIEHFLELRILFGTSGWRCFRTPLIWINPAAVRTPWPEHGPQRKYQMLLFAVKGDKPVTRIYADYLIYSSDENLGNSAQKPVALLVDLLKRSIRAGDSVLDPFAGTGTIFPAAHQVKCRATGIEIDPACYAIAAKRLGALK
jgi:site-specific DNA-methyltransferase (adenine-specific)